MYSESIIATPMRQHAIAPRRHPKFRAARAFYLVILLVTAIASWSFLSGGGQGTEKGGHDVLLKRWDVSSEYDSSSALVRRDKEVTLSPLYCLYRCTSLKANFLTA